ncbi:MAG: hypothetical protein D6772_12310 [Bacteroidetes bacterium]|nr:MAG: hypothetical protein D6772_12310 [Bacteroidota bacterium]
MKTSAASHKKTVYFTKIFTVFHTPRGAKRGKFGVVIFSMDESTSQNHEVAAKRLTWYGRAEYKQSNRLGIYIARI